MLVAWWKILNSEDVMNEEDKEVKGILVFIFLT